MKKLILFSPLAVCSLFSVAQDTEFSIHANGLIYDEQTMDRLGSIVDSLNVRFKTCEPREYRSLEQGFATIVLVEKDVREAEKAMNENMPLKTFLKSFPHAKTRQEWIVKFRYTDYDNRNVTEYATLPLRTDNRLAIQVGDANTDSKNTGWIFEESGATLASMYVQDLKSQAIPGQYAELIQYVDCMIDTTAAIYLTKAKDQETRELPADSKIRQYLRFASDFREEPQMPDIDWDSPFAEAQYEKYSREYQQWNNARLASIDDKMKGGSFYKKLLVDAMNEALESGTGDEMLEFYVGRYLTPAEELKLKRIRRPVGFCSQDQRPRIHAQQICKLAAETTQWDIFLRAHLDIMNDNFERRSDGTYAWARRGTYLKELEDLDLNTLDLLIGTCLRSTNVSDNHYRGDIGRIGRALSETKKKDELEERLLSMVKDEQLDLYNRLLIAYLFENYNHHLPDGSRKKENVSRFRDALTSLPNDIGRSFGK